MGNGLTDAGMTAPCSALRTVCSLRPARSATSACVRPDSFRAARMAGASANSWVGDGPERWAWLGRYAEVVRVRLLLLSGHR